MRELLGTPKAMNAKTELEIINVNAKKVHGCACDNSSKMGNQQPSLFEGDKTCNKCGCVKHITEFRLTKMRGKTVRLAICLTCQAKWHREHYQKHIELNREINRKRASHYRSNKPEKAKNAAKKYRLRKQAENREKIYAAYGNKCVCCGEDNPLFLTVDHVNSDGYLERKNKKYTSGSQFYSLIVKQNFPDKYQLLCYNCNMGRARNNGICPHWEGSTAIPQGSSSKRSEALISVVTDEDMVSSLSKDKAA
jgi:hypothetical protein